MVELEKYYNYTLRNYLLTKFNNLVISNNLSGIKFTIYFKKFYVIFLSILILNLITMKKPSLILSFKGYKLGMVPVGVYFNINSQYFTFLQKILLLFLGVIRDLNTLFFFSKDNTIIIPLMYDFSDLFEFSSFINYSLLSIENLSYSLLLDVKITNIYYNEFLLRSFRLPVIHS